MMMFYAYLAKDARQIQKYIMESTNARPPTKRSVNTVNAFNFLKLITSVATTNSAPRSAVAK